MPYVIGCDKLHEGGRYMEDQQPVRVRRKRAEPQLMTLEKDNRMIPSDGRFHPKLAAEYYCNHGRTRWVPHSEVAKIFFLKNTKLTRESLRRRLSRVWWSASEDFNELLVYQFDEITGISMACKVYDPRSVEEQQTVHERLERMKQFKLLSTKRFQKAERLAATIESVVVTPH
jgi:hypothetical protein